MRSSIVFAVTASLSTASAAVQGFNYGATKSDGSFMFYQDYKDKFNTAQGLVGASGFNSARLYTMIQGGSSTNEPTQAIQAAIDTDTSLLLGLWGSGGDGFFQAEITSLKTAISQYGDEFTKRVVGISVGSEDLYRISPTGIAAKSGYGAGPDTLVSYIGQLKSALAGTALSGAKIGHVDTWTAWVNGSNSAVAEACDWVGMDAYPYFQNTMANGINSGKGLFNDALAATQGAVGGKDVWITETGWPVSGPTENQAVPSTENAKTYWDEVACPLLGNVNTWWFTLQDSDPTVPAPSFGLVGSTLSTTPLYDLSCKAVASSSSASSVASSSASQASSTPSAGSGSTSVTSEASPTTTGSSGSESSGASSLSSAASSLSTLASATELASSGGGLSPSQGAGIGGSPSNGSGAAPTGTNGTLVASGTPSPTPTPTGVQTVSPNSGATRSGSIMAAFGAILAAAAML